MYRPLQQLGTTTGDTAMSMHREDWVKLIQYNPFAAMAVAATLASPVAFLLGYLVGKF